MNAEDIGSASVSLTVTDTRGWLRITWNDMDSEVVSVTLSRLNEQTPKFEVPASMIGKSGVNSVFDMEEQINDMENGESYRPQEHVITNSSVHVRVRPMVGICSILTKMACSACSDVFD